MIVGFELQIIYRAARVSHVSGPRLDKRSSVKSMEVCIGFVNAICIDLYKGHIRLLIFPAIGIGLIFSGIGTRCTACLCSKLQTAT